MYTHKGIGQQQLTTGEELCLYAYVYHNSDQKKPDRLADREGMSDLRREKGRKEREKAKCQFGKMFLRSYHSATTEARQLVGGDKRG